MKAFLPFENTGILFDFEDCSMHFLENLTYDQMHHCSMTQDYKFLNLFLQTTFLCKKDPIVYGKLYCKMKTEYIEKYNNDFVFDYNTCVRRW